MPLSSVIARRSTARPTFTVNVMTMTTTAALNVLVENASILLPHFLPIVHLREVQLAAPLSHEAVYPASVTSRLVGLPFATARRVNRRGVKRSSSLRAHPCLC